MSRSYQHICGFTDKGRGRKHERSVANRIVRKHKLELCNGNMYKKIYDSWNIHDYKFFYFTRKDLINYKDENTKRWPCYKDLITNMKETYKGWRKK